MTGAGRITRRPWGVLEMLLARTRPRRWNVLGCVGPEERALTAVQEMMSVAESIEIVRVEDPPSRYSAKIGAAISRHDRVLTQFTDRLRLTSIPLFATAEQLVELADSFVERAGQSVVVDITCFPKRHFFAIIRRLLASGVRDLMVTYTFAAAYAQDSLAEDPEPASHLPLFAPRFPEPPVESVIVGLGFQPLGIPEILEDASSAAEVTLLFPYPGQPDEIRRIWNFVRAIQDSIPRATRGRPPQFMPRADVSEIFDHLHALTDAGRRYAVFAPYGPKPMSLAMCLFASCANSPVYYTQPKVYNPHYSQGVATSDGRPAINAYCLTLDGRRLYEL